MATSSATFFLAILLTLVLLTGFTYAAQFELSITTDWKRGTNIDITLTPNLDITQSIDVGIFSSTADTFSWLQADERWAKPPITSGQNVCYNTDNAIVATLTVNALRNYFTLAPLNTLPKDAPVKCFLTVTSNPNHTMSVPTAIAIKNTAGTTTHTTKETYTIPNLASPTTAQISILNDDFSVVSFTPDPASGVDILKIKILKEKVKLPPNAIIPISIGVRSTTSSSDLARNYVWFTGLETLLGGIDTYRRSFYTYLGKNVRLIANTDNLHQFLPTEPLDNDKTPFSGYYLITGPSPQLENDITVELPVNLYTQLHRGIIEYITSKGEKLTTLPLGATPAFGVRFHYGTFSSLVLGGTTGVLPDSSAWKPSDDSMKSIFRYHVQHLSSLSSSSFTSPTSSFTDQFLMYLPQANPLLKITPSGAKNTISTLKEFRSLASSSWTVSYTALSKPQEVVSILEPVDEEKNQLAIIDSLDKSDVILLTLKYNLPSSETTPYKPFGYTVDLGNQFQFIDNNSAGKLSPVRVTALDAKDQNNVILSFVPATTADFTSATNDELAFKFSLQFPTTFGSAVLDKTIGSYSQWFLSATPNNQELRKYNSQLKCEIIGHYTKKDGENYQLSPKKTKLEKYTSDDQLATTIDRTGFHFSANNALPGDIVTITCSFPINPNAKIPLADTTVEIALAARNHGWPTLFSTTWPEGSDIPQWTTISTKFTHVLQFIVDSKTALTNNADGGIVGLATLLLNSLKAIKSKDSTIDIYKNLKAEDFYLGPKLVISEGVLDNIVMLDESTHFFSETAEFGQDASIIPINFVNTGQATVTFYIPFSSLNLPTSSDATDVTKVQGYANTYTYTLSTASTPGNYRVSTAKAIGLEDAEVFCATNKIDTSTDFSSFNPICPTPVGARCFSAEQCQHTNSVSEYPEYVDCVDNICKSTPAGVFKNYLLDNYIYASEDPFESIFKRSGPTINNGSFSSSLNFAVLVVIATFFLF